MSEWPIRIFMYGAGDAIQGRGALDPQIQAQISRLVQVATGPRVAAVVQLDSSARYAIRGVLDPWGRYPPTWLPETNTGDPEALVDFVRWGAALCPARRSVLVLSGHGMAWEDDMAQQILGTRGLTPLSEVREAGGGRHHARRIFGRNLTSADAATRAVLIDGDSRDFLSNAELGV